MVFGLSVAVLYEIYSLLGAELQQNLGINQGWLVVWNIFSIFPYIYICICILGIIIPTLIFSQGLVNHQPEEKDRILQVHFH